MIRLTPEQKLTWGLREIALVNQTRPKSHEAVMAKIDGQRIRRDAIGATNAEVKQLMEAAAINAKGVK